MRSDKTMAVGPERWATVERVYHAAQALPVDERASFLAEACPDEAIRREVESLLAQPASEETFLGTPAVAIAAEMANDGGAASLGGRRIGAYQILGRLGTGGMGEVYRARDTRLGRDVAIKILPREFTSQPDRLARFEREARDRGGVRDRGVPVRDVGLCKPEIEDLRGPTARSVRA